MTIWISSKPPRAPRPKASIHNSHQLGHIITLLSNPGGGCLGPLSLKHAVILQVCSLNTPFVPKIHLSLGAGRVRNFPFRAFLGAETPAKGRPKRRVAPRRSDSVPAYHRAHSVHSLPSPPPFRTQRSPWSKDTAPAWHTSKGANPKRCWELWSDGRAERQDHFRSALEAVLRESLHWTPKYASHAIIIGAG